MKKVIKTKKVTKPVSKMPVKKAMTKMAKKGY